MSEQSRTVGLTHGSNAEGSTVRGGLTDGAVGAGSKVTETIGPKAPVTKAAVSDGPSGAVSGRTTHVPDVRDIDVIYRETDRLYYEVARGCGLSTTAFWALVAIVGGGGTSTQAAIVNEYSYSRQTVNSAIKSLVKKGLVQVVPGETDRRSKEVTLTPTGRVFCEKHINPAIDAERRAFESLPLEERAEFVRIVRAYTDAIDAELSKLANADVQPTQSEGAAGTSTGVSLPNCDELTQGGAL